MRFQRKEWLLPGRFDGLRVVRRVDLRPEERDEATSGAMAASWVDRWYQDERAWEQVIEVYMDLYGRVHAPQSRDRLEQHALMRMRRAFDDGELQILGDRPKRMFPLVAAPALAPEALGPAMVAEEELHEIAVLLLDAEGHPLDVDCEIKLPGKQKSEGKKKLSGGRLRMDAKQAGTCTIQFPGLGNVEKLPLAAGEANRVVGADQIHRSGTCQRV